MAGNYLNRIGFQRAGLATLSSAPWYRGVSQPGVLKAPRGFTGMQDVLKYEAPAAGAGIALALRQKDRDKPVTTETEEPKLPEQKPPEGPDIVSEIVATEVLKESEDKIKNKITTWEDHFPTIEEATKAAKDVGGTLKEFEEDLIEKKITFRKTGDGLGFEIYFDKKFVGELSEVDPYKEDPTRRGNQKSYSLRYIDEDGHPGEAFTTIDGQKFAKEKTKELVARDLLRKDDEGTRLRDIFQNLEYNKKGEPKAAAEAVEKIRKLIEKNKEKKAYGGLIDKPLTGRSRDI